MSATTIEVQMGAGLRVKLNAIAAAFGNDMAIAPLVAGAQIVAAEAQPRAPIKTGQLRRSIRVEIVGKEVLVGSDVPYARRIEYGFHGADSRGRTYHQAAQPYLRPAADQNKARILAAVAGATDQLLRRL